MSGVNFIFQKQFNPHKNTHVIYEEQGELRYSENRSLHQPAALELIQKKVANYIQSGAFRSETPENLKVLLKNVKILNEKFESHNEFRSLCCSKIISFILRLFGLWNIKALPTEMIESALTLAVPPPIAPPAPLMAVPPATEPPTAKPASDLDQLPVVNISIRIKSSTFVGQDQYDKLAGHLTTLDGKPIPIPPTDLRVEIMTLDKVDNFPSCLVLPSSLFEGREQGDEICLRYDGKPFKLVLQQQLDHQGKELSFEKALETVKICAAEGMFIRGGFEEANEDDAMVVNALLKNARYFSLAEVIENEGRVCPRLSCNPLKEEDWKALKKYLKPGSREIESFDSPSCKAARYVQLKGVRHYEVFFSAVDLQRNSLRLMATENKVLVVGDLKPFVLNPGEKLRGPPPAKARKEAINFDVEKIKPETVTVEFDDHGHLILRLSTSLPAT